MYQRSSRLRDVCEQAVKEMFTFVKFVPDWFVTAEMLEKCKDEEWLRSHTSMRKAQKAEQDQRRALASLA